MADLAGCFCRVPESVPIRSSRSACSEMWNLLRLRTNKYKRLKLPGSSDLALLALEALFWGWQGQSEETGRHRRGHEITMKVSLCHAVHDGSEIVSVNAAAPLVAVVRFPSQILHSSSLLRSDNLAGVGSRPCFDGPPGTIVRTVSRHVPAQDAFRAENAEMPRITGCCRRPCSNVDRGPSARRRP